MRNTSWAVSGLMVKENAKELHLNNKENKSGFNASDEKLQHFKKKIYGVRILAISGEKLFSRL